MHNSHPNNEKQIRAMQQQISVLSEIEKQIYKKISGTHALDESKNWRIINHPGV